MMKNHSSSSSTECSLSATSPTKDETIVAQILLDLKFLLSLTESLSSFNWSCRRRRSCYDAAPPFPRAPSPRTHVVIEERTPPIQTEEIVKVQEKEKGKSGGAAARTTASPDTPLCFSPSETDEQSKHSSKRNSKKRQREDYINMIEGLTQRKDLLRGEIENVKKYCSKLKAYNSELKAKKQEVLNVYPRKQDLQMGVENYGTELAQHSRSNTDPHQQPLIDDPTVHKLQQCVGQLYPSVNYVGPLGFDLNLPADEALGEEASQPLDSSRALVDKRAGFAEARRRRREIMRTKSTTTKNSLVKNCQQADKNRQ